MFSTITPMTKINGLNDIQSGMFQTTQGGESGDDFRNVFNQAVSNVVETEQVLAQEQYKFLTGQSQDTHSLSVAATQAQISLELLTSLRDKSLEAYNELMRLNI